MTIPRPGVRIRLLAMPDDPYPVLPGSTGTVTFIRRCGTCRTGNSPVLYSTEPQLPRSGFVQRRQS
jgi:hypothetical protein